MEEVKETQTNISIEQETASPTESLTSAESSVEEAPVRIRMLDANQLTIDERLYKVLTNYHNGLNIEMFNERFSDVLNKYDYIVGDIGFEQLRLKGFYENNRKKAALEQRINALEDYLYEYCNFGCAYFVIEKVNKDEPIVDKKPAYVKEKKGKVRNAKQQVKKNKQSMTNKNQKTESTTKTTRPKKKQPKNNNKNKNQVNHPKKPHKNKKSNQVVSEKTSNEKSVDRQFTIRRKEDKK